jgi:hypothetical protein
MHYVALLDDELEVAQALAPNVRIDVYRHYSRGMGYEFLPGRAIENGLFVPAADLSPAALEVAESLAPEWTGTLEELVEIAKQLGGSL